MGQAMSDNLPVPQTSIARDDHHKRADMALIGRALRVMLVEIENNPRQSKRERTRASLLRVRIESATRQGWGKR